MLVKEVRFSSRKVWGGAAGIRRHGVQRSCGGGLGTAEMLGAVQTRTGMHGCQRGSAQRCGANSRWPLGRDS